MGKFKQGDFDKYNPKKYYGHRPIKYRSSWEFKMMIKLELNPMVEKWSSEEIVIPYTMLEKVNGKAIRIRHNYHTDFTVHLKTGLKYILEVKPNNQTPRTVSQIKRDPVMYKNSCKWKAALAWAKQNGYEFKIINEEHLKTKIF